MQLFSPANMTGNCSMFEDIIENVSSTMFDCVCDVFTSICIQSTSESSSMYTSRLDSCTVTSTATMMTFITVTSSSPVSCTNEATTISSREIIVYSVVAAVFVFAAIILICFFCIRKKLKHHMFSKI